MLPQIIGVWRIPLMARSRHGCGAVNARFQRWSRHAVLDGACVQMALSGHARGLTGGGHRRLPGRLFENLPEDAFRSLVGGRFARLYVPNPIG